MHLDSPLIEADQIGRRTPGSTDWLIRDVSFCLRAGQRIAIVGSSGAGKTLLLRSLALLDPLDEGQLLWRGKPIDCHEVPEYRSHVIYVHQKTPLIDASVEENLRYPFTFNVHRNRSYDKTRVQHWLHQVGRDESFLKKSSRDLSGGETQLVALLRAMMLDPTVLLLDEPTGAIDSETQQAVERLLRKWMDDPTGDRSILLVSHDRQQAYGFANQVLPMQSGRLVDEIQEPHGSRQ